MSDITTFARKELEHEVWRKQDYAEYYQLMHSLINIIESQQEKLDLLTEPPSEIIEFLTEGLAQKDALIESQKEEIEKLREIQRLLIFNEEIRELTPMQQMSLSMKLLSQEGDK